MKIDSNVQGEFIARSSLILNLCLLFMYIATPPLVEFILFLYTKL